MLETFYQTAGDVVFLYQTADAGVSPLDSGCWRHSIRHRMQEYLHQTAEAGDSLSDNGFRSLSIRQRLQENLYQTADAGDSLSDIQRIQ